MANSKAGATAQKPQQIIAITGATGFVGGHLLNQAVRAGYIVRALTRKKQDDRPNVTWVRGALDDQSSLAELCSGADAVIHIAGVVNAPTRKGFEDGNVTGTMNMVEAAKQSSAKRFIHVSSLSATLPKLSIYGETKARAEKIVGSSGLDWTIIRPPWVYGPGDSDTLDMFKSARLGFIPLPPDADGLLSAIHVDDLARALLSVVPEKEELTAQIFEVDDGKQGGWSQVGFAKAIGSAMGKNIKTVATPKLFLKIGAKLDRLLRGDKAKLTQDRVNYFCHDDWRVDATRRLPPEIWEPKIDTVKGLTDTAKWYRYNDWL